MLLFTYVEFAFYVNLWYTISILSFLISLLDNLGITNHFILIKESNYEGQQRPHIFKERSSSCLKREGTC